MASELSQKTWAVVTPDGVLDYNLTYIDARVRSLIEKQRNVLTFVVTATAAGRMTRAARKPRGASRP